MGTLSHRDAAAKPPDERAGFLAVPNGVLDAAFTSLPAHDFKVYLFIRFLVGSNSRCWPALDTIAARTAMSRSEVIRSIGRLTRAKWIDKQRGERRSNAYVILPVPNGHSAVSIGHPAVPIGHPRQCLSDTPDGTYQTPKIYSKNNTHLNKGTAPEPVTAASDPTKALAALWTEYRRGGRDNPIEVAETFAEMIRRGSTLDRLADAIRADARDRCEPIWRFRERCAATPPADRRPPDPEAERAAREEKDRKAVEESLARARRTREHMAAILGPDGGPSS